MSGNNLKQRTAINLERPLNKNECILKECYQIYTDSQNGLVRIAKNLDLSLQTPRKKISIMLIGNHSAGKSTFINWYIEEHVQKTGVAIETQGFSLVTSGRRRESLTGNATLHLYPHFLPLTKFSNLLSYLTTEVSTSQQKKFPLVTFVDTPGLVDGDMKYPFDVDQAILWLGNVVDLIFVFFDPIGQALCKRTLNIVEELNKANQGRMKFCLSKADEAGHESDRQRVMMQIVQEVCKRPGLNGTCFDMPTIYIPNKTKHVRCVNQIEDMCKDIEKTIDLTIQTTLNQLEMDCNLITLKINEKIEEDDASRYRNFSDIIKGIFLMVIVFLIIISCFIDVVVQSISEENLVDLLGKYCLIFMYNISRPFELVREVLPKENIYICLTNFLVAMICIYIFIVHVFWAGRRPVMTKKRKKLLLEQQEYVSSNVHSTKNRLYKQYLQQTIWEHDLD